MSALLTFVASPAGRIVGALAVALVLYGYGYSRGYSRASGACESAALRAQILAMEIDQRAASEAAARFEREAQANAGQVTKNQAMIEEIRREPNKTAHCRLGARDINRLHRIR